MAPKWTMGWQQLSKVPDARSKLPGIQGPSRGQIREADGLASAHGKARAVAELQSWPRPFLCLLRGHHGGHAVVQFGAVLHGEGQKLLVVRSVLDWCGRFSAVFGRVPRGVVWPGQFHVVGHARRALDGHLFRHHDHSFCHSVFEFEAECTPLPQAVPDLFVGLCGGGGRHGDRATEPGVFADQCGGIRGTFGRSCRP